MDVIFPVPNAFGAQFFEASWRLVVQPRASVAEKWSSTNRIRSQFARIKAAARHRYRVWLLRKTRLYGTKSPPFAADVRSFHNEAKVRTFRKAKVRTFRIRKSGNVGTIGRGDQAAHHTRAGLDKAAGTARRLGFDHPPGAAISQQGRQHGVVQLVAATYRAVGAEQRQ